MEFWVNVTSIIDQLHFYYQRKCINNNCLCAFRLSATLGVLDGEMQDTSSSNLVLICAALKITQSQLILFKIILQ